MTRTEPLRSAERARNEPGGEARYLRERMRAGLVDRGLVTLAAYAGGEAERQVLGVLTMWAGPASDAGGTWVLSEEPPPMETWADGLSALAAACCLKERERPCEECGGIGVRKVIFVSSASAPGGQATSVAACKCCRGSGLVRYTPDTHWLLVSMGLEVCGVATATWEERQASRDSWGTVVWNLDEEESMGSQSGMPPEFLQPRRVLRAAKGWLACPCPKHWDAWAMRPWPHVERWSPVVRDSDKTLGEEAMSWVVASSRLLPPNQIRSACLRAVQREVERG